ncbi:MAG: patatin-like phospholipase family protein [Deltaproteobacteria bacterium]|nr:patatin-like phospholipase family protein [Deltaproteobacteria bacterium]
MTENLVFYAGRKAFEIIREEGLRPDRISVVAGAAGGPKWLVLRHLDRVIFSDWFKGRELPLFLIGSSIGAWRFAGQCMADPKASLSDFESAYIHQAYAGKPSPEAVSRESARIQQAFLKNRGPREILDHPYLRLNFMAVRSKGPAASDRRFLLATALLIAALGNLISRSFLKVFFERTLFYDSRSVPPFFHITGFPIHQVPLTPENLPLALLASGSIPLVMSGVRDIPESPSGIYRDGGVIDYHMDIPFSSESEGLTLFPHYMERIIPGWLDKKLSWRKPGARNMANVLMMAPSRHFIDRLPYHKIPDRNDFYRFEGKDSQRFAYWSTVARASQVLADEFMEAVLSGNIRNRVRSWDFE